ncbi:MAG: PIN domain-containing protein [Infirmifilum sp.]
MPRAVIDTNVLVFDTFEDAPRHEEASQLLDSLDVWVLPLIVVYEYVWFLKGLSIDAGVARRKVLEYVRGERSRVLSEGVEEVAWALEAVVEEGLSLARFNDKVVLAVAAKMGLPLATFDEGLRRQARRIGVETMP